MFMPLLDATKVLLDRSTVPRAAVISAYIIANKGGKHGGDEGPGSQLQRWSSLIGIVTAIIGNILISFALNTQRYAHIKIEQDWEERKEKSRNSSSTHLNSVYGTTNGNGKQNGRGQNGNSHEEDDEAREDDPLTKSYGSIDSQGTEYDESIEKIPYLHSGYWWAGIILMTIGETGNFLAYGFAPASIVSPLGVVALISNCVIAPIMLKEKFRWRDFWGVLVAVGGAITVVLSAKQQEKKLGPHEVIDFITTMEFEIYMAITFVLIGVLMWASPKYGDRSLLIDLGLVGLFGAYTALSTKGVASMLSSTLWKAFTTPITYVLIIILIGTAIMQVKYVNKALQRFDSTQVIPVQFVLFTLSVIIGSAVLYRDFESTTTDRAVKFIAGCFLTFFGVFLITSGRSRQDDSYDEEVEDVETDEERINLMDNDTSETPMYMGNKDSSRQGQVNTNDGSIEEAIYSRRSSRVSFAPSIDAPSNSRPATSNPPAIALAPPDDTSSSSLLSNPWKDSHDQTLAAARHPGLPATSSTSALPSNSSLVRSSETQLHRSNSHSTPSTPSNQQSAIGPPPADPPRPVTPRHSLRSNLMPGPFISPLSSSLSAVVADTLRRGVDSPLKNKRSFHRPRILRRGGSDRVATDVDDEEAGNGSSLSKSVSAGAHTRSNEDVKRSRARSLSNALGLGDLFKSGGLKRQKRSEYDTEDQAGPSNSR